LNQEAAIAITLIKWTIYRT